MTILEEISSKKKKLEKNASEKDKVFYKYLSGENVSVPSSTGMTDILKICYASFSGNADVDTVVKDIQKTQPMREGFHYSKNLVELIAVALQDYDGEKENLKKFVDEHGGKEAFLINKLFPDIEIKQPRLSNSIDKLAIEVLANKDNADVEGKILTALNDAGDLSDIFIIEQATNFFYKKHPSTDDKKDIKYLLSFYLRLHKFLYVLFSIIFYIVLIAALFVFTYWVTPYVVSNWSTLEPYIFIIQTLFPILVILILAGLQKKLNLSERIKPTQDKVVHAIESAVFKLLRMDLDKVLKIESSYEKR